MAHIQDPVMLLYQSHLKSLQMKLKPNKTVMWVSGSTKLDSDMGVWQYQTRQ